MRYQTVVFDFDGTVADTAQGIFESVQYALKKLELPPASEQTLRCFIGPPLPYSFRQFIGLSDETAEQAVRFYRENYSEQGKYKLRFYDGIPELMLSLRRAGVHTCLASAKPDRFIQEILKHFGAQSWFDCAQGMPMQEQSADKSGIILDVMNRAGAVEKDRVLMVGDTKYDMIGAKELGVDALGVLYGYGSAEELTSSGADYIVRTPQEIATIVGIDK
ncbi:MAG: HAD hydrolase-like protein [Clostridia bacterium]|nr:HAD hydrolase-like protein [Clostridia bacterium]